MKITRDEYEIVVKYINIMKKYMPNEHTYNLTFSTVVNRPEVGDFVRFVLVNGYEIGVEERT